MIPFCIQKLLIVETLWWKDPFSGTVMWPHFNLSQLFADMLYPFCYFLQQKEAPCIISKQSLPIEQFICVLLNLPLWMMHIQVQLKYTETLIFQRICCFYYPYCCLLVKQTLPWERLIPSPFIWVVSTKGTSDKEGSSQYLFNRKQKVLSS